MKKENKKKIRGFIDKHPFLKSKKEFILNHRKPFGIFFIFLGILGLFLPFLQGIVLILLGLFLFFGGRKKKIKK